MAPPKYVDLLSSDIKELAGDVKEQGKQISKLAGAVEGMAEKMPKMQEQLDEHTRYSTLAHERIDKVEDHTKDNMSKMQDVHEYVQDQRKEKEIRQKIEIEQQEKRDKRVKNVRYAAMIMGIPLGLYGIYEVASKVIAALLGVTP
jgi:hypothetical protein